MTVYIVLWLIIVSCLLYETVAESQVDIFNNRNDNARKISFWICFFTLLIIGLFRAELLGADVLNYQEYFNAFGEYSSSEVIERVKTSDPGYYLFGFLFYNLISSDFYVFKCVLYFITLGAISLIIYKKSSSPAMSFLIYLGLSFLGMTFCLLRQATAVALCFLAYSYWEENKKTVSMIFFVLAVSFHLTALFFVLVLLFMANKDSETINLRKNAIILIASIIISAVFMPFIISLYADGRYDGLAIKGEGEFLLLFYVVLVCIFARLIFTSKKSNESRQIAKRFEASSGALYFQAGALFFSLINRAGIYFASIYILALPQALENSKEKDFWKICFIAMFSFLYFLNFITGDSLMIPFRWNF